ncbi:MAG: hypothetical protein NTX17_01285 [Candidatus Eisenbacteria bacterium]|nr:hypothetical protein [Candidatus Eisenbacteria bacterium]
MEEPNRYTDFSVSTDLDDVLRLLGYGRDKKPGGALARMLGGAIQEAEGLARPSGIASVFEKHSFPKGSFLSALFEEDNSPAIKIALAVCTIGPLLEESVSRYSDSGQLTRALVIDAAGSSLTETVCDFVNERICQTAAGGTLYPAPRISPGYGHWKIEEQEIIFGLLPAESVGVSLTESYMMIPRKSVSFAVKLLGESSPEGSTSACKRCGRSDCQFRREPRG